MMILSLLLVGFVAATQAKLSLEEWLDFKETFGKRYANVTEELLRRTILASNKRLIDEHNERYAKGETTFKLGLNQHSDLSHDEYMKTLNGYIPHVRDTSDTAETFPLKTPSELPAAVDWRTKGAVTPVKNQGSCGSCWAFSTTGSLEGQNFLKTGKLVSLSEQQLVDCDKENLGCKGGWMEDAFEYIKQNGGIDTNKCYPYKAKQGACRYKASCVGATVKGYVNLPEGNETALMVAVATKGPISVALHSSFSSFHHYRSGVYYEPGCNKDSQLTHAMLVVGYGTDPRGGDYWIVKNSWKTSWGERGYIKMSRNRGNNCGIATAPSFPLV